MLLNAIIMQQIFNFLKCFFQPFQTMICVIIAIKHGFLIKYTCVGPQGALSLQGFGLNNTLRVQHMIMQGNCVLPVYYPKPLYKFVCVLMMFVVLIIMSWTVYSCV